VHQYRTITLAALIAGLQACSDAGARQTATVRDSAGVSIVESTLPAWNERDAWTLDTTPVVDIGGTDDPDYDLVQVGDAVRLSDGRIAVFTNATANLRIYDSTGAHLLTTGRSGDGPGEFRAVETLERLPGDTLLAYDYLLRRMSVISPEGEVVASHGFMPTGQQAFLQPLSRLPDGSWFTRAQVFSAGDDRAGVKRDSLTLLRVSPGLDSALDTIGRFPSTEMFIQRGGSGEGRFITFSLIPFGLATRIATHGARIYVGDPGSYEIRAFRADGTLERILRRPVERRAVDPAEVTRLKEQELAATEERWRRTLEDKWKNAPVATHHPAFASMTVGADGDLWVEEPKVTPDDPGRASVFDPDGRLLGSVPLPGNLRITEIGRDYLLGVWKDESDLEHVRLYRVRKPG